MGIVGGIFAAAADPDVRGAWQDGELGGGHGRQVAQHSSSEQPEHRHRGDDLTGLCQQVRQRPE